MGKLREGIEAFTAGESLPFHMPGHKRALPGEFYRLDVTELPATDDLYEPTGILRASQEWTAGLYGADRSFYLVNGSSVGVLTALSAAVRKGGTILMQRASHKSAYHAVMLRELKAYYLEERTDSLSGAGMGVSEEELLQALKDHPEAEAVFLTAPSYEGYSPDLRKLAEHVHAHGIPLIVDAAHGAHFGFHPLLPESAVQAGADLTVMSVHKTLPAPTQSALLHLKGTRVSARRILSFLSIFQSSSPSYPLMIGIEDCLAYLSKGGKKLWEDFFARRKKLDEMLESPDFYILSPEPCKLLICPRDGRSGSFLAAELRKRGIEPEMALPSYVLLILSVMDTEEMYERLARAVRECAAGPERFSEMGKEGAGLHSSVEQEKESFGQRSFGGLRLACVAGRDPVPEGGMSPKGATEKLFSPERQVLPMSEAWEAEREYFPGEEAEGRISAAFVMAYPPGRPLLVPGERIGRDILREIARLRDAGCEMRGIEQ